MWRALVLHRLGQSRLKQEQARDEPGMFATQDTWCQHERNYEVRYPRYVIPGREKQECLVPRIHGASMRGTRKYGTQDMGYQDEGNRNVWYPGNV